jgi:hypothetical protein
MVGNIDHLLVTRFNLPSKGNESLIRAREGWLRDRIALFERYCLPSVEAQTNKNFSWLVYFDPASPSWLLDRVKEHERGRAYHPVFREEVTPAELVVDASDVIGGTRRAGMMTTNLDNDDGIAADFVERLQAAADPSRRQALYLADGLIRRGDSLFVRVDVHNAFCSVAEPWDSPMTCWADWHNLLPVHMPATVLRGAPGWLQVIHDSNVSNRVRGRLTDPSLHRATFAGLIDDMPVPSRTALVKDATVSQVARGAREGARATVKAVLSATGGKDGLDRAKAVWTSLRHVAR